MKGLDVNTELLLVAPMAKWEGLLPRIDDYTIVEAELAALAVRAARLSAYITWRKLVGSDQGHVQAVKRQNKVATGVRKAIGFTQAEDDLTF